MKIIIDDIIAQMGGEKEIELSENAWIRFKFENSQISCTVTKKGLCLYKVTNSLENKMKIIVESSDMCYIS